MPRPCRMRVGLLCVPLLYAACGVDAVGWAQNPDSTSPKLIPRTKAEREHRYQAHHLISLIAQVTESSGKPVTGLKADDFFLLDNQTPAKITSFHEFEGPAST